ncbi:hypothetical protein C5613_42145 [Rhodococcus opacus]|uniref:Uncharacterized protein n=1 Tax=Rhodococcus opacus TaxID=37919 RepID=A0A2S8IG32_RHOOP|nr:hypothetical protein C5613_42145 [Rhodococcus opacus]
MLSFRRGWIRDRRGIPRAGCARTNCRSAASRTIENDHFHVNDPRSRGVNRSFIAGGFGIAAGPDDTDYGEHREIQADAAAGLHRRRSRQLR